MRIIHAVFTDLPNEIVILTDQPPVAHALTIIAEHTDMEPTSIGDYILKCEDLFEWPLPLPTERILRPTDH